MYIRSSMWFETCTRHPWCELSLQRVPVDAHLAENQQIFMQKPWETIHQWLIFHWFTTWKLVGLVKFTMAQPPSCGFLLKVLTFLVPNL